MRPDVDISKMPVHKARHLEAVDFKKKVCAVCCCWGWDLVKKKILLQRNVFLFFSQEHMTLLYRSVIFKNKSFIYIYS